MSNSRLVGHKFRDLHSLRRSRIVTVQEVSDTFYDHYTFVKVTSNRGRTTQISYPRFTNNSRFQPIKTRKGN